jgi:hypothetical protein
MTKTWRISIEHGAVLVEFEDGAVIGAVTFVELTKELNSDPDKYRSANLVVDLRNIVPGPDAGFEGLQKAVRQLKEMRQDGWQHNKTALVVTGKHAFGLSRIYASLVEGNLDYSVNVFEDDLQAAMDWARTAD